MSTLNDPWYVRFPDGRVRRAASTEIVRLQLGDGRIPPASLVRRTAEDEWTALQWVPEFADLAARLANHRPAGDRPNHRQETVAAAIAGAPRGFGAAPVSSPLSALES